VPSPVRRTRQKFPEYRALQWSERLKVAVTSARHSLNGPIITGSDISVARCNKPENIA
jgi:hypothetical protein